MGQYFQIIDLDDRANIGGGNKLGCFFWDYDPGIMESLRVPQTDTKIDKMLQGVVADQSASPLLRLPADLFDPIIKELVDARTRNIMAVFSLSVTCKTVLKLSRKHIAAVQKLYLPSRAGHRIICIGEYAWWPSWLPRGMLTAEEEQELREFGKRSDEHPCLWTYAMEHYEESSSRYSSRQHALAMTFDRKTRPGTPKRWLPGDWALVWNVASPTYPNDRRVLCNLTKHEYIREDTATQLCEGLPDSKWGHDSPGFWQFMLASICWSPDCTIAMAYDDDEDGSGTCPLTQARWAGDRFAITVLEDLPAQGKGPWKDVTVEVGELIKRMWNAECRNDSE